VGLAAACRAAARSAAPTRGAGTALGPGRALPALAVVKGVTALLPEGSPAPDATRHPDR